MIRILYILATLSALPATASPPESLCAKTTVYRNSNTPSKCTPAHPQGNSTDLNDLAQDLGGQKNFLTLVKSKAIERMRRLAATLREPYPGEVPEGLKAKVRELNFLGQLKEVRVQLKPGAQKPEDLQLQLTGDGVIDKLVEEKYRRLKPDWEQTKIEFLGKDTRLESSVFNARFLPRAEQAAREAQSQLQQMAKERSAALAENNPLLTYIKSNDPGKGDLEKARGLYAADLDREIEKVETLDPGAEAARALALFAPSVDDVLREHPEYCEAHSSLLSKLKSAATKRAVGATGVALLGGGTCAWAALVSEGVLALPCVLAAATVETATAIGAAMDAKKEANVLFAGYLGRQSGREVSVQREDEAGGYLWQAGLAATGALAAAPGALNAAKNIPRIMAEEAASAPKPLPRMQAKRGTDFLPGETTGIDLPLAKTVEEKIGTSQLHLSDDRLVHLKRRHVFSADKEKDFREILEMAAEKPGFAAQSLESDPRLMNLLQEKNVTSVTTNSQAMKDFIEQSAKNGKLERYEQKQRSGTARFKAEVEGPQGKTKGEVVICLNMECLDPRGRVMARRGDVVTAYFKCGPNIRHLPSRETMTAVLTNGNASARQAALQTIADNLSKFQPCP